MPSPNEILAELKKVKYPGFTRDIVSFGIIKDIEVAYAGVTVSLTMASAKPEVVEKMKSIFTWLGPGYDKIAVEQAVMDRVGNTVVRLPMVYGAGDPLHRLHGVLKRIKDSRPAIILPDDHAAWRGPRGYVENVFIVYRTG